MVACESTGSDRTPAMTARSTWSGSRSTARRSLSGRSPSGSAISSAKWRWSGNSTSSRGRAHATMSTYSSPTAPTRTSAPLPNGSKGLVADSPSGVPAPPETILGSAPVGPRILRHDLRKHHGCDGPGVHLGARRGTGPRRQSISNRRYSEPTAFQAVVVQSGAVQ